MFDNFSESLFDDRNFKEDSVREVIIVPILRRLGYFPTGDQNITRSKHLKHPFIFAGTRKCSVSIIPDYTLNFRNNPVLVLDAKNPLEDLDSKEHIQQAYSYAIHPEIKTKHFALCNGRRLVVFSIDSALPLLDIPFSEFESRWDEIEKFLLPKYLLEPGLRNFTPDFGTKISRMGLEPGCEITMLSVRLGLFAMVEQNLYTATVNTDFAGADHCVSFDFNKENLFSLVAGFPSELKDQFLDALLRAPFKAGADLELEVDLNCQLGHPIQVEHESFVPLVIKQVYGSRFLPGSALLVGEDIPSNIFRISKTYKINNPEQCK
ncbi:type I restriction enzyme HsdR N-terminal domain-containing protein [Buttiauxella selenatireducens]|uniref:Type I restriction enzyme HsdR N-terminal domain-containing protein n=1 Tax=Buttiauxella selenatireducens TaxID=3073902 RepID=A0ABY9SEI3_9ENTR|nr:type I restriction enzyme HsdR N-terminal domain-containing protein [Buttiauxella sp. R73]WMY75748.1 type I restriction enzyme HsdR N-terminal domain-containing protein [Buttiauxella sp. R73]